MSLLYESDHELDDTQRFRAPTIDEALAEARSVLGHDVRIVEANRIRRGGVGGFFATDLGVELVVTAGDDAPTGGGAADRIGDVDAAPEYIDVSTPDGRVASSHRGDRSRADARPQFYDRVVEEDRPVATSVQPDSERPIVPDRLERLLESANGAERAHRTASFADHFERQMRIERNADPTPADNGSMRSEAEPPVADLRRRPAVDERSMPSEAEPPVADLRRRQAVDERSMQPEAERRADPSQLEPAVAAAAPDDGANPMSTVATPTEPAVAEPALEPTPEPASEPVVPASSPSRPRRTSATRDPLRRPIDLAAGAVGRLVEQLSDVTPADGSRMRDLTRLVVTVTTADGTAIEIAAELENRRD